MNQKQQTHIEEHLNRVFTPSFPIRHQDFLFGRQTQLRRVEETVRSPGRHAVIYGPRGVGKTSLASILEVIPDDTIRVKMNCEESDTFKDIWNRVLSRIPMTHRQSAFGFSPEEAETHSSLVDYLHRDNSVTASDVASLLEQIRHPFMFILDEYDRVTDDAAKVAMADLIKNVSDNNERVTFVIVGVGDTISGLLGDHPSIARNLSQIEMPLLEDGFIQEILVRGCQTLGITFDKEVPGEVARLAAGFPHYAHLLGLAIGNTCLAERITHISRQVFDTSVCGRAVDEAQDVYRRKYGRAVASKQSNNRFELILYACAFATVNHDDSFRPTDVVNAANSEFGQKLTVQALQKPLPAFTEPERGPILEAVEYAKSTHYRFLDLMMRSYLRIRGKTFRPEQDVAN